MSSPSLLASPDSILSPKNSRVSSVKNPEKTKKILHHLSTANAKQLIDMHKISILSFNSQSINKHINEINILTHQTNFPSIINISETWQPYINTNIPNYHPPIFKTRTGKKGGGVAIYCHINHNIQALPDLDLDSKLETISAEITTNSGYKFIITSAYFPPNLDHKICLEGITSLYNKISKHNLPFIITGDFNIDINKHTNKSQSYASKLQSLQLTQHITTPTRITNTSETIIDHIITSPNLNPTCNVLLDQIADHHATLAVFKNLNKKQTPSNRNKIITNFNQIIQQINNFDWTRWISNQKQSNSNLISHNFTSETTAIVDANKKTVKISRNLTPKSKWIQNKTLILRLQVQKIRKKFLRTRKQQHEIQFKSLKKIYEKALRNDKRSYYISELQKCQGDSKRIWQIINEITGRKNTKNLTIPTNKNNSSIANDFNHFFKQIALNIQKSIPTPNHNFDYYLKQSNIPKSYHFSLSPITSTEVAKVIQGISNKNSNGFDNISNKILKACKNSLSEPIATIINNSFKSGHFPESLKISKIFPLFKAGDKNSLNNYRPISQLSRISKIAETIAINQLNSYLDKNNIISKYQFGFREKHSTEHALLAIKQNLEHNRANNNFTIMVSIDLSKAFDTVDNNILIQKLKFYGCDPKTCNWFQTFLTNRKQYVQIEDTKSNLTNNHNISVVQGSTCGPKLFSIYINDLPEITNLKTYLFADDTTLAISGPDLPTLEKTLQTELQKIADYFKANKLSLNTTKSTYIIIPPKKRPNSNHNIQVKIGQLELHRSKVVKFLGILIDENLTFKQQFQNIIQKVNKGLAALCSVRNILTYQAKKLIYYGLIHSHLNYCPLIWGTSINQSQTFQLQKLQKKSL